jgi:hypothetical protein
MRMAVGGRRTGGGSLVVLGHERHGHASLAALELARCARAVDLPSGRVAQPVDKIIQGNLIRARLGRRLDGACGREDTAVVGRDEEPLDIRRERDLVLPEKLVGVPRRWRRHAELLKGAGGGGTHTEERRAEDRGASGVRGETRSGQPLPTRDDSTGMGRMAKSKSDPGPRRVGWGESRQPPASTVIGHHARLAHRQAKSIDLGHTVGFLPRWLLQSPPRAPLYCMRICAGRY